MSGLETANSGTGIKGTGIKGTGIERAGIKRWAIAAALLAALTTWSVAGDCAKHVNIPAHNDPDGSQYQCGCGTGLIGIDWKATWVPCQAYYFKYPAHTRCLDETWNVTDCKAGKPKDVVLVHFKCACECVGGEVGIGGVKACLGYWQANCRKKKGKQKAGTIATDKVVDCDH